MGLIGCPETLVRNYLYLLHNKPEKSSFLPKRLNSPGIDHIPAVLIKARGRTLHYETNTLINSSCLKQELPDQWKDSIIVPIYEMGNKTDCKNYTGISLLLSRLTTYAEENSGNHHGAFRRSRPTTDHKIFCIHQIRDKKCSNNKFTYLFMNCCCSHRLHCLRCKPGATRWLRLWFPVLLGSWMSVCYECCVSRERSLQ